MTSGKYSMLLTTAGAATAAGVVSFAGTAAAALMTASTPVSVDLQDPIGSTGWDVDGDGNPEFNIRRGSTGRSPNTQQSVHITSAGLGGGGFVATDAAEPGILGLSSGFQVGPTMASNTWGLANVGSRLLAAKTVSTFSPAMFGLYWLTQTGGDVKVGFRFRAPAGTQYGWALFNIDLDGLDTRMTIKEWTYETEADTDVSVGERAAVVSEPATALPALALLGLGAAGVRRWRKSSD